MSRDLPATPEFARPTTVAEPKVKEPLVLIATRERQGRLRNAETINKFRNWYDRVREEYRK